MFNQMNMQSRLGMPLSQENPLWISWHDTNWIAILNPNNVLDYFMEKSNPFYDRTCNNEIVKMQRQSYEQLVNMIGVEYILLHVQDPILYVIRKQHRHSPAEATPMADYYIIAGTVYQAPDLASVFNSRLLSTVHHLQSAFEEASSYYRYHPNKGYTWDFASNKALTDKSKTQPKKPPEKPKVERCTLFQRQRVDMLLHELLQKFPMPANFDQQKLLPPAPQLAILDGNADQDSDHQDLDLDDNKLLVSRIEQSPSKPIQSPMNPPPQSSQNGASTSSAGRLTSPAAAAGARSDFNPPIPKMKIKQEMNVMPSTSQQAGIRSPSVNRRANVPNMSAMSPRMNFLPPNTIKIKQEIMGPPPDKRTRHF